MGFLCFLIKKGLILNSERVKSVPEVIEKSSTEKVKSRLIFVKVPVIKKVKKRDPKNEKLPLKGDGDHKKVIPKF